MIKEKNPYDKIVEKHGISKTFISNINNGKFFFDEKDKYPLCSYRIDKDTYDLLIEDLEKPLLTFKELASKYELGESTVKKFNYGTLRNGYYNGEYPIRKLTPSKYKAEIVIEALLNTNLSKTEIMSLAGVSEETVRRINLGLTNKKDDLVYPLR